jgi:hypothetical protein
MLPAEAYLPEGRTPTTRPPCGRCTSSARTNG